jgi:hypothetical protein
VPVSSKEIKSKAGVMTRRDILSTKIKTLDSAAVQLGVDDQSGEKRRRGKELKGKSSREKNGEKETLSRLLHPRWLHRSFISERESVDTR